MKHYSIILIGLTVLLSWFTLQAAPEKKTIQFKVSGNCEMCKKKIETALEIKGVKSAVWNMETNMVEVVYTPEVVSVEQLHQAIADAGYDTELVKAKDEVYNKLAQCCQYRK